MARNVLGLLASAIACFFGRSFYYLRFNASLFAIGHGYAWELIEAMLGSMRERKSFSGYYLDPFFTKICPGALWLFYPAACFPLDPFLAQVFEAWIRLSVHSLMHEACALRRRLMAYTTVNKAVPHVKAYLWPWKERRSTSSCNQKHGVYPWPWFPAELFVVTIVSVP